MRAIFFLLDVAPYGSEKAFGLLNAAAASINLDVTLGLYEDGVYLALAGQDSRGLGAPNLSDLLYSYPEMKVLAHEPSMVERNLMNLGLIETVELLDDDEFMEIMASAECVIAL